MNLGEMLRKTLRAEEELVKKSFQDVLDMIKSEVTEKIKNGESEIVVSIPMETYTMWNDGPIDENCPIPQIIRWSWDNGLDMVQVDSDNYMLKELHFMPRSMTLDISVRYLKRLEQRRNLKVDMNLRRS